MSGGRGQRSRLWFVEAGGKKKKIIYKKLLKIYRHDFPSKMTWNVFLHSGEKKNNKQLNHDCCFLSLISYTVLVDAWCHLIVRTPPKTFTGDIKYTSEIFKQACNYWTVRLGKTWRWPCLTITTNSHKPNPTLYRLELHSGLNAGSRCFTRRSCTL